MHCQELDFPVLHRKADFPDVYAGISNRDLISVYRAGPTRLGGILAGLSDEELTARPRDGKWSAQEIAMHIADAEIMGAARLRQTLAEPGASFAIYDQEAWASTLDYRNRDRKALESAVRLFSSLRTSGAHLLESATEEDWKKWGCHADWGPLTVGRPVEIPLLLRKRLY
jgi:hypothetical protein